MYYYCCRFESLQDFTNDMLPSTPTLDTTIPWLTLTPYSP